MSSWTVLSASGGDDLGRTAEQTFMAKSTFFKTVEKQVRVQCWSETAAAMFPAATMLGQREAPAGTDRISLINDRPKQGRVEPAR